MSIPHLCFASVRSLSNRTSAAITQLLSKHLQRTWFDDGGQDIAEYAVMLAVILVIVVGTLRLIGRPPTTPFLVSLAHFNKAPQPERVNCPVFKTRHFVLQVLGGPRSLAPKTIFQVLVHFR